MTTPVTQQTDASVDFDEVRPAFDAKWEHDGVTVDLTNGLPGEQRDMIRQQRETILSDLTGEPPAFETV